MGQKGGKPQSSTSSASSSPPQFESLDAALSDDTSRSQLISWAKSRGLGNAVLCFEAIHKRRNVYSSGKRCGDGEEALAEKMSNLGQALLDKYVAEDAEAPLGVDVDVSSARGANVAELDAFDGLAAAIKAHVEKQMKSS